MSRKDFQSVAASLSGSGIADQLPTQRVEPSARAKPETPPPADPVVQFSFGLRKSLRKELARLAADADMPVRAFILDALREKGLSVTDEDLVDRRKERG